MYSSTSPSAEKAASKAGPHQEQIATWLTLEGGDPFHEAGFPLRRTVIDSALQDLAPSQREVVTLRDVEGWSSDEVCNVLGLSETNQRVL